MVVNFSKEDIEKLAKRYHEVKPISVCPTCTRKTGSIESGDYIVSPVAYGMYSYNIYEGRCPRCDQRLIRL